MWPQKQKCSAFRKHNRTRASSGHTFEQKMAQLTSEGRQCANRLIIYMELNCRDGKCCITGLRYVRRQLVTPALLKQRNVPCECTEKLAEDMEL
jgi:hypothetical protein